jgi:inorganic pyrophosphatase
MGHRGEDGDALDCLVCVSEPTFPGCVVPVKPVGLLKMHDEAGPDDKVVCVPLRDPGWSGVEDLGDLPQQLLIEVEHFFNVYKELEGKPVETDGWRPRAEAQETIDAALRREEDHGPGSVD